MFKWSIWLFFWENFILSRLKTDLSINFPTLIDLWYIKMRNDRTSDRMKPKVDVLNSLVLFICIQELICSWPLPTHPPFAFQFYFFFICLSFCLFYVSRLRTYRCLRWGNRYLWPRRGNGLRHTVLFRRLVQRWLRWRLVTVLNKSP